MQKKKLILAQPIYLVFVFCDFGFLLHPSPNPQNNWQSQCSEAFLDIYFLNYFI